eukprot:COSAG01_NODE_44054_length_423_cov_0.635802_1_plen_63_part_10
MRWRAALPLSGGHRIIGGGDAGAQTLDSDESEEEDQDGASEVEQGSKPKAGHVQRDMLGRVVR